MTQWVTYTAGTYPAGFKDEPAPGPVVALDPYASHAERGCLVVDVKLPGACTRAACVTCDAWIMAGCFTCRTPERPSSERGGSPIPVSGRTGIEYASFREYEACEATRDNQHIDAIKQTLMGAKR